ncbi:pancreatic triacylglycerol lipase [Elysia marginata]|uniref:Pancreatic triacylglycerol lipase n=1 Tax=Elysia marginata TaxID=1093978 RepID=A0AAV4HF53_9GAST|nr:pancreatic triacylglycerol lipase [Elysia marginata]
MPQSKSYHAPTLAWPWLLFALTVLARTSLAATRCYDNLGCYQSLTLHALPQEPVHLRTEYRISCRGHTNDAVVSATDSETVMKDKIEKSCFVVDLPVRIIIHGFRDSASASWVSRMRDAFLAKEDCNVIAVDWHHGAPFPYEQAVANSFLVATQVAHLIRHLELVHVSSKSQQNFLLFMT